MPWTASTRPAVVGRCLALGAQKISKAAAAWFGFLSAPRRGRAERIAWQVTRKKSLAKWKSSSLPRIRRPTFWPAAERERRKRARCVCGLCGMIRDLSTAPCARRGRLEDSAKVLLHLGRLQGALPSSLAIRENQAEDLHLAGGGITTTSAAASRDAYLSPNLRRTIRPNTEPIIPWGTSRSTTRSASCTVRIRHFTPSGSKPTMVAF